MNKKQKLVQERFLDNEEEVIKLIEENYKRALDSIIIKSKKLQEDITELEETINTAADGELKQLLSMKQSKIYQMQYQDALRKQINSILDELHVNEFKSLSEYLKKCYEDGFIGTLFDLQGQGIPLIFPIDQESVVRAVQLDSKISEGYYQHLGADVALLKKEIAAEVSRNISIGTSWGNMALILNAKMQIGINNAIRVARTEGHRIQNQAAMDACYKAKDMGCDTLKQWDASLDKRTRRSHQNVDGEIKELDEPFSNGLMYPGDPNGRASEVINCRCALLQRGKWELDGEELETLKERAKYYGLDKSKNFEDFKKKYLKAVEDVSTEKVHSKAFDEILDGLKDFGVEYREVKPLKGNLTAKEIIDRVSGGDMTKGSCASLGLAYIGNKNGLDVLDFRDGVSREFFSYKLHTQKLLDIPGVKGSITKVKREAGDTAKIIQGLEYDKEYYMGVGKHAAIIRNTENGAEYLELQSKNKNGWKSFDEYGSIVMTLRKRFGCRKTVDKMKLAKTTLTFEKPVLLIDVDSLRGNNEFKEILGYINTSVSDQKKGALGGVK